jgi:hypothetical protein
MDQDLGHHSRMMWRLAPLLPLDTRTRSPKGLSGPARRIRNRTGGHPATTHAGLRATANSAQEGRFGMFLGHLRFGPIEMKKRAYKEMSKAIINRGR